MKCPRHPDKELAFYSDEAGYLCFSEPPHSISGLELEKHLKVTDEKEKPAGER